MESFFICVFVLGIFFFGAVTGYDINRDIANERKDAIEECEASLPRI